MIYEVEQKYRAEHCAVANELDRRGIAWHGVIEQRDVYFNHPQRDFAQTDEALRVRSVGQAHCITYKGPKLDRATKTRRELELPLPAGASTAEGFYELLSALGFRRSAEVIKTRRAGVLLFQGRAIEVALDTVANLGEFVELELAVEHAELSAAQACIVALAAELGLSASERRSYLEMVLESRGGT